LFREFAITVTMTIAVSAFVSLTLSPMMCSLFLRNEKQKRHSRAYMVIEHGFEKVVAGYTRGLDWVLAHQRLTLGVFLITLAATVVLYIFEPKGFFPQQDTDVLAGLTDASQDVSFAASIDLQKRVMEQVVQKDPDVAAWAAAVGGSRPVNTGFAIVRL